MEIVIVDHSGFSHTKIVAESVIQGVKSVTGVIAHLIEASEAQTQFALINQISGNPTLLKNHLGSNLGLVAQLKHDAPTVIPPVGDRLTAELFSKRVAIATQHRVKGA